MGAFVRTRKRSLEVAVEDPCSCCYTLVLGGFWARNIKENRGFALRDLVQEVRNRPRGMMTVFAAWFGEVLATLPQATCSADLFSAVERFWLVSATDLDILETNFLLFLFLEFGAVLNGTLLYTKTCLSDQRRFEPFLRSIWNSFS